MTSRGRLEPAVAAVRLAVRRSLGDLPAGQRLVVACSGGADSMALGAASAFEAGRAGRPASAVVVDHGLHDDSAVVAARVADALRRLEPFAGLDEVTVVRVEVGGPGGLEAAARRARYDALATVADHDGAVVLLGHTLDDQAETVLLGLARGSGPRSMAGMRPVSGIYRRPLMGLSRLVTRRACLDQSLPVWEDPANLDRRFARVRVRRDVLPLLEAELGPGVAEALARTATQLAEDVDALDEQAAGLALVTMTGSAPSDESAQLPSRATPVRVDLGPLRGVPAALRRRVLRLAALAAGCPGGDLSAVHIAALDGLVIDWHGQRRVDLPGPVAAVRRGSAIELAPVEPVEPVEPAEPGRLPADAQRPAH